MKKNFLHYLESDYSNLAIFNNIDMTKKEELMFFLNKNRTFAKTYIDILQNTFTNDKIGFKALLEDFNKLKSPNNSFTCNLKTQKILFNKFSNQIGKGELLVAWCYKDSVLTTNESYDIMIKDNKVEIKTPEYRFGTNVDVVIQGYSNIYNGKEYNFWDEISYTIKKIIKLKDDLINIAPKLQKEIKYIEERASTILRSVSFIPKDVEVFNSLYKKCNKLFSEKEKEEELKESSYSRIELSGNYIPKKKIITNPIPDKKIKEIENSGGELKIQVIPEKDKKKKMIIGSLFDLVYVRHPKEFLIAINGIIKFVLKDDRYYIFFDKNGGVVADGTNEQCAKNLKFYSISTSRIKLRPS